MQYSLIFGFIKYAIASGDHFWRGTDLVGTRCGQALAGAGLSPLVSCLWLDEELLWRVCWMLSILRFSSCFVSAVVACRRNSTTLLFHNASRLKRSERNRLRAAFWLCHIRRSIHSSLIRAEIRLWVVLIRVIVQGTIGWEPSPWELLVLVVQENVIHVFHFIKLFAYKAVWLTRMQHLRRFQAISRMVYFWTGPNDFCILNNRWRFTILLKQILQLKNTKVLFSISNIISLYLRLDAILLIRHQLLNIDLQLLNLVLNGDFINADKLAKLIYLMYDLFLFFIQPFNVLVECLWFENEVSGVFYFVNVE